ncbi:MAG: TonB-dependent receptor [Bacteroidales bacterium]|nr:TonB-dependent receptor [Bacteroidales bacterium]
MKRFALFFCFIIYGFSLAAQSTVVRGSVVDKVTGEGEPSAVIQFFLASDESKPIAFTTTDENGNFAHSLQGTGDFYALYTQIGRKDARMPFTLSGQKEITIGTILAEDDAEQLAASSVTAQKVLVKMDVDKMTYEVAEDVDSNTSTVLDMLRKVPMVTVDAQDNITVNGSSSFQVTVDGKPNPMMTQNASKVFKMMPASTVKSIEVITNPGVKYDAEGVGGVLNLTTNTDVTGGTSAADGYYGSIRLETGTMEQGAGLFYSLQKGKFAFSLDGNVGYQSNPGIENTMTLQSPVSSYSTYSELSQKSPMAMGDMSLSYEIDSLNLLSANAGLMSFNMRQNSTSVTSDPLSSAALYESTGKSREKWNEIEAGADYQHKWKDAPGRMFTLSWRFSGSPEATSSESRYTGAAGTAVPFDRKSDVSTMSSDHTLQADYTMPVGESGTLSTGLKYTYRHHSSDNDSYIWDGAAFARSEDASLDYDYFNRIGAAYAEYTAKLGDFSLKGGLRYEHTWQDVKYPSGDGRDFSTAYGSLVPTASVQYNISLLQNIGLSYNMRIRRPGITYLNPYRDTSDPLSISYGNSDLEVEKGHNISLVYNFFTPIFMLNATLRHSFSNDGISAYSFYEDGLLNNTYGNILQSSTTGLNLFANLNLGTKTRVYTNGSVNYSDYRSEVLGQSNNGWGYNIMFGAQHTIPWDIQLSLNFIGSSKHYSLQGWRTGFNIGVIGLTKTFFSDRLSLSAMAITNFNKGKMKMESYSASQANFVSNTVTVLPIRQLIFSISWTFGSSRSISVKKAERGIVEDSVLENRSSSATSSATGGVSSSM